MKRTHKLLTLGMLIFCCTVPGARLEAGSGSLTILPANNGKKLRNGIIARVDTRWTDGWGYRPVRITLSVRKSTKDRTIQVDLYPESHSSYYRPLLVSTEIEIPQGQREVSQTVYVPQQLPWSVFRAEFFEGGRKLKDLSMEHGFGWSAGYNPGAPCLLMVDADAPRIADDREQIMKTLKNAQRKDNQQSYLLPDAEKFQYLTMGNFGRNMPMGEVSVEDLQQLQRANDLDSLRFVSNVPNLEILPPADLPTSHVGLAGIDLIIISLSDLASMSTSQEDRFQALDFHLRSGGNLIIYGEGPLTADIEALFGLSQGWSDASRASFDNSVVANFEELDTRSKSAFQRRRASVAAMQLPATRLADYGLGRVIAIESSDPYGQSVAYWQWVLKSIGLDRLTWPDRMGVSMVHNNQDYWDFMIPGFGAAPVKRFLGVICVFIIVIGPLNFFVLNRVKRLYLLPVTVGLAALLTTVGMLAYAVVSDGISTRVRLRSYTWLDQRHEETIASTYCRHSYLAAIAPSDGLVFPDHTCIYPILPYYDGRRREERLTARTGKRILGRGYLRSRSTTQFLTTDVLSTEPPLDLMTTSGGQGTRARNQLDVPLVYAWVRDGQGALWEAAQVAAKEEFTLQRVEPQVARERFMQIAAANAPQPPPGLDKSANRTMFGDLGSRRYYYRYRSTPVYSSNSILESSLQRVPQFFRSGTPDTFLLVTEKVPAFIATGTRAKQEAGFHIMEGRW